MTFPKDVAPLDFHHLSDPELPSMQIRLHRGDYWWTWISCTGISVQRSNGPGDLHLVTARAFLLRDEDHDPVKLFSFMVTGLNNFQIYQGRPRLYGVIPDQWDHFRVPATGFDPFDKAKPCKTCENACPIVPRSCPPHNRDLLDRVRGLLVMITGVDLEA